MSPAEPDTFIRICSSKNLRLAYEKARKRKTLKQYVIEFEKNLGQNLTRLKNELLLQTYRPRPLKTFIIRDPKTRKISKSDFRDRIVHHAICNIIEPLFDKTFIHDSYANRKGKGPLKAIERFDEFKRKVSKNNTRPCFTLKADVKHYFETVDHEILVSILEKRVPDKRALWLIKTILANHKTAEKGKGMPLGNLTSQFFANVYLNELDQYAKHELKARHYIRYVDDIAILDASKKRLETYKEKIGTFLTKELKIFLHPDKTRILRLDEGIDFLGFRIFYYHKLIRKKNIRKFRKKLANLKTAYSGGQTEREKAIESLEGWLAYASHANTHKYRKRILQEFSHDFPAKPNAQPTRHRKFEEAVALA